MQSLKHSVFGEEGAPDMELQQRLLILRLKSGPCIYGVV